MLRDYFEIASNGDYSLLIISGKATQDQCKEQWNKIVTANFDNSGSTFDFLNYVDNLEGYNHFLQEHNVITAQLIVLHFQVDSQIIEDLKQKGYNIDTTGKNAYLSSLIQSVQRSKHIVSQIKLKANEMQQFSHEIKDSKPTSFDEIMATLIMNLGMTVPDNITLARYNQFRRKIEERRKANIDN